jgi:hypothetical protein
MVDGRKLKLAGRSRLTALRVSMKLSGYQSFYYAGKIVEHEDRAREKRKSVFYVPDSQYAFAGRPARRLVVVKSKTYSQSDLHT